MVNSDMANKVNVVSVTEAAANYRKLLGYAHKNRKLWDEGQSWYADAQTEALTLASQIHSVIGGDITKSLRLSAALIAGASPAKSWEQGVNQMIARNWAMQLAAGVPVKGHMAQFNVKAQQLWDSVVLHKVDDVDTLSRILTKSESKVSRFFRNILGDMEPVTIDGHMVNAAEFGMEFHPITRAAQSAKQVRVYTEALKEAAEAYGLEPAIAQAIIWVAYKSLK